MLGLQKQCKAGYTSNLSLGRPNADRSSHLFKSVVSVGRWPSNQPGLRSLLVVAWRIFVASRSIINASARDASAFLGQQCSEGPYAKLDFLPIRPI